MSIVDRVRNDARLLAGQVADAAKQGSGMLIVAILCAAGMICAAVLVLAAAVRS